jgi:hypothetical protein
MATFTLTLSAVECRTIVAAAHTAVIDPNGDYKDAAIARSEAIVESLGYVPLGMPSGFCAREFCRWLSAVLSHARPTNVDESTWTHADGSPECGLDE